MALIKIEQNAPHTLELAQMKVLKVTNARSDVEMDVCWAMAAGYFLALSTHKLIDNAVNERLDAELDQARVAWRAVNNKAR